jgi:hypothetical protein
MLCMPEMRWRCAVSFSVNLKTVLLAVMAAAALIGAAIIVVPSTSDHIAASFATQQSE